MAVNNFRFQRHLKLWEDQNKQIKRTIFLSLIIGILLLIDVLTPLTRISSRTDEVKAKLQQLRSEQEELQKTSEQLIELEAQLARARDVIAEKPWEREKISLIRRFRLMRNNPDLEINYEAYTDTADVAIRRMANTVRTNILEPLKKTLESTPEIKREIEDLQVHLSTMENTLSQWERNHLGEKWYLTLEGKGRTVEELDYVINTEMSKFANMLKEKQDGLKQKQTEVAGHLEEMDIGISEKEKWLADLNQKMQEILPGWAKGFFDVEDVVQLFPLALIVLTTYIVALGVSLTKHFLFIANEIGLKNADRADPAVSSWWTLVSKGKLGTFLTLATYVGLVLILWLFFEWGYLLFQRWLATTDIRSLLTIMLQSSVFPWLCRVIFLLLIFILLRKPKLLFELN